MTQYDMIEKQIYCQSCSEKFGYWVNPGFHYKSRNFEFRAEAVEALLVLDHYLKAVQDTFEAKQSRYLKLFVLDLSGLSAVGSQSQP